MTTETTEVHLNSSANDVWGAVTAATTIYPRALRGLYQGIRSINGDGFTAVFNRVVLTATERIQDVDYENLIITSTFTDDDGFVPKLFDTFDIKLTVVRAGRLLTSPGCTIKWEFTYTGANGNVGLTNLQNVMKQAFKDLDVYLRNHRGIRP
ncbi:hypothetical protein LINPERPRIM_LOCUS39405 [Linum perenne]